MDELIQSIYDDPESWTLGQHTFNRHPHNIWIANGMSYIEPYHTPALHFSFINKWRFWRAYKWWCKHKPLEIT